MLVDGVSRRIKSKVDVHSAVGGAQVTSSDEQPPNQAERCRVAEHIVAPGCSMGLLGEAGGHAGWLPPSASSSPKVSPPLIGDESGEGGEVGGVSVDVPDQEGRTILSQLMVTDDSLDDGISSCCFGGVAMRAAVSINIVPMA